MDKAFTFHLGLMLRVMAKNEPAATSEEQNRLATAWRRWKDAADALDEADETEDFQAVGMRLREALLTFVKAVAVAEMIPEGEDTPKIGDFVHWSERVADAIAKGPSSARFRGHLKATAKSTWELIRLFKDLVSGGITVGQPQTAGPLNLFPLSHSLMSGDHLLYQDAQAQGLVVIEETSDAGTVGELRVTNRGTQAVLLLEGEVLLGMKQTRVLNASILVPGLAMLTVPVSCVEVGRWHHASHAALGKDRLNLSPKVRGTKTASVMRSARANGTYRSDQGAVWNGVADVIAEHGVNAPTGSYSDLSRDRASDLLARVADLNPEADQAGVLAYIGGRPACLDIFDSPATLGALWESLIGSYAADLAGRGSRVAKAPSRTTAARWVHALAEGDVASTPAIGLGDNVTSIGPALEAAALLHNGRLVHLAAFPGQRKQTRSEFVPPTRRRA
jgi:hypothetical protein